MSPGARQLLRRLPLLVVLLALAWLFYGERPRRIELVYDLPDDPAPQRVEVSIVDEDGRIPAAIEWGGAGAATDRQIHRPLLAPGTYRIEAELLLPGGARRRIERELQVGRSDERIVLHLR